MHNENAEQLAQTLRRARLTAGLSVRQLEAQSGVAKSVISRFERKGTGSAHNLPSLPPCCVRNTTCHRRPSKKSNTTSNKSPANTAPATTTEQLREEEL